MTHHNKAKSTPKNRLQRLRDEALFIKHFHYVSDLQPDEIQAQLEQLTYQPSRLASIFFPRRRMVKFQAVDEHHTQFEIKTKVGGLYTELRATGDIRYDPTTQQTVVSGSVKFDAVYLVVLLAGLFFLITWVITSLSRVSSLPSPFILLTLGMTNLFYFRQMFLDRNELIQILGDTLTTQDITRARKRLANANHTSDDYLSDADDLNQQQAHL